MSDIRTGSEIPDLSEFVQPEFLADYQAWYAAVTADAAEAEHHV